MEKIEEIIAIEILNKTAFSYERARKLAHNIAEKLSDEGKLCD